MQTVRHPLLALVALCSQAFSLFGPGIVVCRDQQGRVCFELVGQSCTCCRAEAPAPQAPPAAVCGCGKHHDEPADTSPSPAGEPCDCEHRPLADGADTLAVLAAPASVDPPAVVAVPWAVTALAPLPAHSHATGHHDPPGAPPARSAHLPLLAGVVIRC